MAKPESKRFQISPDSTVDSKDSGHRQTPGRSTHTHTAKASRLERGSNHGEPTPLTLGSRYGSAYPLLRPGECATTPGPLGECDETRGSRLQNDTGFFLETSHTVCIEQTKSYNDEPTKLKARQRRVGKAHSDSLRRVDNEP